MEDSDHLFSMQRCRRDAELYRDRRIELERQVISERVVSRREMECVLKGSIVGASSVPWGWRLACAVLLAPCQFLKLTLGGSFIKENLQTHFL